MNSVRVGRREWSGGGEGEGRMKTIDGGSFMNILGYRHFYCLLIGQICGLSNHDGIVKWWPLLDCFTEKDATTWND